MDSNNETKNSQEQEIDLSYIYKSTRSFFRTIEFFIYRSLRFALKNSVMLCVVAIIGIALGYFWDKQKQKIYKHEIIVKTNFNSASFLYKKIANTKYSNKDNVIKHIAIAPIIDVRWFVEDGSKKIDVAKYLSANNIEISRHKDGNQTEVIYQYHTLSIYTKGQDTDGQIVKQLLDELNSEPYYVEIQKTQQQQTANIIEECQKSIEYINVYFQKISSQSVSYEKNVNIDFEGGLANLITQKNQLLVLLERYKKLQIEEEKIFFDVSILPNIYLYKPLLERKVTQLPILLVFAYLGLLVFIERYKKYRLIEENKQFS